MKDIIIGAVYNIKSVAGSAKRHPNPIFQGKVIQKRKKYPNCEQEYKVEITAYNITDMYEPGMFIDIEDCRFLSIVSNKSSVDALMKWDD